jgi:hypothetical protein
MEVTEANSQIRSEHPIAKKNPTYVHQDQQEWGEFLGGSKILSRSKKQDPRLIS